MPDMEKHARECMREGFHCSQTIMLLSFKLRRIEGPFTIRAMGGLGGGMFAQRTCGALTGGACVLASYYAREKGTSEPIDYQQPVRELVEWFEKEHGSIECRDLRPLEEKQVMNVCPGIVAGAFEKCCDILKKHGIEPAQRN